MQKEVLSAGIIRLVFRRYTTRHLRHSKSRSVLVHTQVVSITDLFSLSELGFRSSTCGKVYTLLSCVVFLKFVSHVLEKRNKMLQGNVYICSLDHKILLSRGWLSVLRYAP